MKMEQTECSETSVFKLQTPCNYPKESIHNTSCFSVDGFESSMVNSFQITHKAEALFGLKCIVFLWNYFRRTLRAHGGSAPYIYIYIFFITKISNQRIYYIFPMSLCEVPLGGRLGVVQRRYLRSSHRSSIFFASAFWLAVRELLL